MFIQLPLLTNCRLAEGDCHISEQATSLRRKFSIKFNAAPIN